jgi:UDP-N-acetylglucosamine 1-carboxyvinyltransferase
LFLKNYKILNLCAYSIVCKFYNKGSAYLDKYIIKKSNPLNGYVKIAGSKNSSLPILAATLLTNEQCIIKEVPKLSDVIAMQNILSDLGVDISFDSVSGIVTTKSDAVTKYEASYDLVSSIRASFLIIGPMLARFGKIKLPLPGGCAIGTRPVDLHLKGFSALGADIIVEHGYVIASATVLNGAKIYLDFPSVGATENIIMAAALANGQTILENCAIEPEIVDLANFLNSMGASIRGAGTDTIKINGVESLHGCTHNVIPDRIEAGTFMIASAITHGDIILQNVIVEHLKPIIAKLKEVNVNVEETEDGLRVYSKKSDVFQCVDIKTLPDPGFPSDMQAQFMTLLTLAEGTSVVTETVFENRFMHVSELKRLGANIKIEGRVAIIDGVHELMGTQVKATDLRAGASLILAGLVAKGETEISDIFHIERGYYNIEHKLKKLGAYIERCPC